MTTYAEFDRWAKLIYDLQGTCKGLEAFLEEEAPDLIDYLPFLEYLDSYIFLCSTCGWWCGVSEMYEQETCCDCSSDAYED